MYENDITNSEFVENCSVTASSFITYTIWNIYIVPLSLRSGQSTASCFHLVTFFSNIGHYLFIETSSPAQPGSKARLLSRKFPATKTGRCFTFWYHMYGSSTGELNVYIKHTSHSSLEKIWSKSGNKGEQWLLGNVTVTSPDEYQVG